MSVLTAPYAPLTPSAASQSSYVMSTAPCGVENFSVNTTTTPGWVMLVDATAAPSNGAITPVVEPWQVPANSTLEINANPPIKMTTGAVVVFSTTGPRTLTLSATASFSGRLYQPNFG